MMTATGWREVKYDEVYDQCMVGLERRRGVDPAFGVEELEGLLAHLYIQEGNDQGGRGELQDLILRATIDAHEHFLARWRSGA